MHAPSPDTEDSTDTRSTISASRMLTDLRPGESCRLEAADLAESDRRLLDALGLASRSRLRLCKAGDPWIVQVRGTRIGLAESVARRLHVVVDA